MKRFKWILLSLGCLAIVVFSAFVILKNKTPDTAGNSTDTEAVSALFDVMESSYRINNLPYTYVTEDVEGNKKDISDLLGGGPKMVLRYSELNCNVCVDSAFACFLKFSKKVGENNVILLVQYESSNYLSQLIRLNHIQLPNIYRIVSKDSSGKPDNEKNAPFLFVLDSGRQMKDVFYPLKEIPSLSEMYYNTMFDKYFKR